MHVGQHSGRGTPTRWPAPTAPVHQARSCSCDPQAHALSQVPQAAQQLLAPSSPAAAADASMMMATRWAVVAIGLVLLLLARDGQAGSVLLHDARGNLLRRSSAGPAWTPQAAAGALCAASGLVPAYKLDAADVAQVRALGRAERQHICCCCSCPAAAQVDGLVQHDVFAARPKALVMLHIAGLGDGAHRQPNSEQRQQPYCVQPQAQLQAVSRTRRAAATATPHPTAPCHRRCCCPAQTPPPRPSCSSCWASRAPASRCRWPTPAAQRPGCCRPPATC